MKRIIVPTDFSKIAGYASQAAADLARETGAEIHFIHIINLPAYEENVFSSFSDQGTPEAIMLMKYTANKFKQLKSMSYLDGIKVKEKVLFDVVHDAIADYVNEIDADLVVMGTHGTSGENDRLLGSNMQKMVRLSKVPVIAVKRRMERFKVNEIVYCSNFFEENSIPFNKALKIAKLLNAKLHLVKVITPKNFERTEFTVNLIQEFAKAHGVEDYTLRVVNDNSIEEGLFSYVKNTHVDMIAIGTHGRTTLSRLFQHSVAEEVANQAAVPVLSMRINLEE